MKVTEKDDNCFILLLDNAEIVVSFSLPGVITMHTDDLIQYFTNPRDLGYKSLPVVFPTIEKVKESAQVFKEGITNKERFLKTLHDRAFLSRYNITEPEKNQLSEFIKKTSYPPPTVRQQLYMRGFGRIAEVIDFEDPRPELIKTCGLFWDFIKASRTY